MVPSSPSLQSGHLFLLISLSHQTHFRQQTAPLYLEDIPPQNGVDVQFCSNLWLLHFAIPNVFISSVLMNDKTFLLTAIQIINEAKGHFLGSRFSAFQRAQLIEMKADIFHRTSGKDDNRNLFLYKYGEFLKEKIDVLSNRRI
jgi:hypothetical protein